MIRPPAMLVSTVLGAIACAGCEGWAPPATEPTDVAASAIAGGVAAPSETGTVALANFGDFGSGFCSGSLIAPNLVLTARHCISDASSPTCASGTFGAVTAAADLYVMGVPVVPFDAPPPLTNVLEIVVPESPSYCGADIALLVLESEIVGSEHTPYIPRVDAPIGDGELYSAVGYGGVTDGGEGLGVKRRLDGLEVLCLGMGCQIEGLLPSAYIRAEEFLGEDAVCSGDSGGPAVDTSGRVIGVASRGTDGCATPIYVQVPSWSELIVETAKHAAMLGGHEPAPWVNGAPTDPAYYAPVGAPCTDGAECPSGLCVEAQCSRKCAEAAPCEDGWTCDESVCLPPAGAPPDEAPPSPPSTSHEPSGDDGGCSVGGRARDAGAGPAAMLALAALAAWRARRRIGSKPLIDGTTVAVIARSRPAESWSPSARHLATPPPQTARRAVPTRRPSAAADR